MSEPEKQRRPRTIEVGQVYRQPDGQVVVVVAVEGDQVEVVPWVPAEVSGALRKARDGEVP